MSSSWCSLSMNSMQQSPLDTWSLRKCCFISMYLVLECMTGFLVRLIALVLSHFRGIWSRFTTKSSSCCFTQILWAQQLPIAMYSASVVKSATQACFLQFQDTRELPSIWHVPLVLFYLIFVLENQNMKNLLSLRRYLWDATSLHRLCP